MIFGGAAFGSSALASETPLSTALLDAEAGRPFTLMINGVDYRDWFKAGSAKYTDALGEQKTLEFTLLNSTVDPQLGDHIRLTYFNEVLFDGELQSAQVGIDPSQRVRALYCTALDWSTLLARHKVLRNFSNVALVYLLDSLFDNELAGCGLSFGSQDKPGITLPLVESQGGSALDLVQQAAAATGQVLRIDDQRRLSFLGTSFPPAPLTLNETVIEEITSETTLDDYRNAQVVHVTGTPPSSETAVELDVRMENSDQIAARAAADNTDGRFEAYDKVTHPTSNDPTQLYLLGKSYALAKLTVAGTPKQVVRVRLRGYGFQAAQLAVISHTSLGINGAFSIQRVTAQEIAAKFLRYDLELSPSPVLQRAYDSWLRLIDRGKIIVQLPGTAAPITTVVIFSSPGAVNWTVPAGVYLITLTLKGASASGSGAWAVWGVYDPRIGCVGVAHSGQKGGNGGFAVASVAVTPGDTINLIVGAKGTPGGSPGNYGSCGPGGGAPTSGHDATDTTAYRLGVLLAAAYKGTKGIASNPNGMAGTNGGGSGGIVTVGGGKVGGAGGSFYGNQNGVPGQDGEIKIEYTV